jgi:CRISPR/Cas system CMR subunit Cmr4 (Cas7 group RAMP superfamily)
MQKSKLEEKEKCKKGKTKENAEKRKKMQKSKRTGTVTLPHARILLSPEAINTM